MIAPEQLPLQVTIKTSVRLTTRLRIIVHRTLQTHQLQPMVQSITKLLMIQHQLIQQITTKAFQEQVHFQEYRLCLQAIQQMR